MMNFKIKKEFDYYLYWISERMNIFWRRYEDNPIRIESSKSIFEKQDKKIWSEDKIFQDYKFTNVYRCLDRVSQYLIKEVICKKGNYSEKDIIWRILLFKHFNKIETWKLLEKKFNDITYDDSFDQISKYLDSLKDTVLYSNAYMLTSSFMKKKSTMDMYGIKIGSSKAFSYMKILNFYLKKENYSSIILKSSSLEDLYRNLIKINTVGNFLAMQYSIDLNYSEVFNFDENEFIIPGPGAIRGIDRCFNGQKRIQDYVEIIKWVQENLDSLLEEKGYNVRFLPNRKPTLIDVQNIFCETDKYMRGIGSIQEGVNGKRIKQNFKESSNKIEYFFPKKWNVILK